MTKYVLFGIIAWLFYVSLAPAKLAAAIDDKRSALGQTANGAAVAFVRSGSGDWGIDISSGSAPKVSQAKPAEIEVFRGQDNVKQLAAGYQSVQQNGDTVVAKAKVAGEGKPGFEFEDRWKVSGLVLSRSRKVAVTGGEDSAGFYSAIRYSIALPWISVNHLHGITGLEEVDKDLYQRLSRGE